MRLGKKRKAKGDRTLLWIDLDIYDFSSKYVWKFNYDILDEFRESNMYLVNHI